MNFALKSFLHQLKKLVPPDDKRYPVRSTLDFERRVNTPGITSYTYDANGNILTATDANTNQLVKMTEPNGTVTTYTYDANGNLTKESTGLFSYTQYTYNYEGKLTKVNTLFSTVAEYSYDGDGRRISKKVGGVTTKFYYDNNQIAKELDASGVTQAEYLYGYFGTPVSMTRSGQTYYYIYNAHGDTVALTDALGAKVMTYRYDPWEKVTATGSIKNPFQYVGQYWVYHDEETGFDLMQIRYYNSEISRFITPDTFPGLLVKPISQNGYLYANGDPINHIDPDGHFSWGGLWKSAKKITSQAVSKVKSAVKKVTKTVKKAVKKVKKAVKKVVKKVKKAVKKVVKTVKQTAKKVVKKVVKTVVKAAKAVVKAGQTINNGWEFTKKALRRATEEATKVVKDTIDKGIQVAKEGVTKVGEFMESKTGKMVLAGLQVIGGAMQVAAGVALMSTGVGSVVGALVLAHGVNSMISGAADGYYAATNQNEKMGTVNLLRDYVYKPVLGKELGEKAFNAADFVLGFAGGGVKNAANAATHVDDLAKGLGKVLDDLPTPALKPSTATNAGRNITESGAKSAGRVGGNSVDELATTSLVSKSGNAADNGAKYAGKSSSVEQRT